jgi:hypothetical protein
MDGPSSNGMSRQRRDTSDAINAPWVHALALSDPTSPCGIDDKATVPRSAWLEYAVVEFQEQLQAQTPTSLAVEAEPGNFFEEPSVCDTKINQRPIVKPGERRCHSSHFPLAISSTCDSTPVPQQMAIANQLAVAAVRRAGKRADRCCRP